MTLSDALNEACRSVGIDAPPRLDPGNTRRVRVDGKRPGNRSGAVKLDDDGRGGIATNFVTGQTVRFSETGATGPGDARPPRRDPEAERRQREEQAEVARICAAIVAACRQEPHPYLAAKGFPEERGLVIDDPRHVIPDHPLGRDIISRLPKGEGPFLIVPGRIGKSVTTVQFIDAGGEKLNIYRGQMGGAAHRIASGTETWVCEGIATALTVRAALRLLGRSATVLSAFSASNVGKVAKGLTGAIVAADHDKPLEQLHGLGTGEFYASGTGRVWTQPPALGDFNDMMVAQGLRAVALHLREVRGG